MIKTPCSKCVFALQAVCRSNITDMVPKGLNTPLFREGVAVHVLYKLVFFKEWGKGYEGADKLITSDVRGHF